MLCRPSLTDCVGQQLPAAGHDGAGDALELAPDLELLEEGRLKTLFPDPVAFEAMVSAQAI